MRTMGNVLFGLGLTLGAVLGVGMLGGGAVLHRLAARDARMGRLPPAGPPTR